MANKMRTIAIISWVMFAVACFLPALILKFNNSTLVWPGWECLVRGLIAFFIGHVEILANPPFALASLALLSGFKKSGAACSVIALLLASETFALFSANIYMDEGGSNVAHLIGFGPGFYLWYGAIILVTVTSLLRLKRTTA